jgi:hypothetical protein
MAARRLWAQGQMGLEPGTRSATRLNSPGEIRYGQDCEVRASYTTERNKFAFGRHFRFVPSQPLPTGRTRSGNLNVNVYVKGGHQTGSQKRANDGSRDEDGDYRQGKTGFKGVYLARCVKESHKFAHSLRRRCCLPHECGCFGCCPSSNRFGISARRSQTMATAKKR